MYVFAIVILLFIFYILHLLFLHFTYSWVMEKNIFEPYLHCQYVFHHLDLGLKLWFERTVHSVLVSSNIHRMEDLTVAYESLNVSFQLEISLLSASCFFRFSIEFVWHHYSYIVN